MNATNPPTSASLLSASLLDYPGIRSRLVPGVNGMTLHLLEAGYETGDQAGDKKGGRPVALLLHGFPELAYSWRKIMPTLAAAGFHVIAPDLRGYGGTTGWDARYDGDLDSYRMLNLVRDVVSLLAALQLKRVELLVGHDFGSPLAAWSALIRPDLFARVALMSAPFAGPPSLPLPPANDLVHRQMAALSPARKHYQWYYSERPANDDMLRCPQGLHAFLRAYYHYKSADWRDNRPYPLQAWSASELAKLPTYYVMNLAETMAQTVAPFHPDATSIAANRWLPERELAVYVEQYQRSGFQGGLNWYRCGSNGMNTADFSLFTGRRIDVPSLFIAGASDWGVYQKPGEYEKMQTHSCARMLGCHLIAGAGHWVQQEQPAEVARLLLEFAAAD